MPNALLTVSLTTNPAPFPKLTSRQRQLWTLMASGYTNQAMAQKLGLTSKWVDNAVGQLYSALSIDTADRVHNPRVRAVLLYIQRYAEAPGSRSDLRIWSVAGD